MRVFDSALKHITLYSKEVNFLICKKYYYPVVLATLVCSRDAIFLLFQKLSTCLNEYDYVFLLSIIKIELFKNIHKSTFSIAHAQ